MIPATKENGEAALVLLAFGILPAIYLVAMMLMLATAAAVAAFWWRHEPFRPPSHVVTFLLRFPTRGHADRARRTIAAAGWEATYERSIDPSAILVQATRRVTPSGGAFSRLQHGVDRIVQGEGGSLLAWGTRCDPIR